MHDIVQAVGQASSTIATVTAVRLAGVLPCRTPLRHPARCPGFDLSSDVAAFKRLRINSCFMIFYLPQRMTLLPRPAIQRPTLFSCDHLQLLRKHTTEKGGDSQDG